jgi:hypothetical protein
MYYYLCILEIGILQIFRKAIELGGRTAAASEESVADNMTGVEERRIREVYNILEVNSYDSVITETNHEQKIFQLKAVKIMTNTIR